MGIRQTLGSMFGTMADSIDPSRQRDMNNPLYWADYGNLSVAGVTVTEKKVSQLGAVQAVRFGLSGAMGSLPVMVFRRGEDGGRIEQPDHALAKLLGQQPNGRNTPSEFFGEIAWHVSFWRNAYCQIHPGTDYAIGELEIIHPRRLIKIEKQSDAIYYEFRNLVPGAGNIRLRDDEVWHIRGNPLCEDGLKGEGIWESAREVFGRAIAVHEYGDIWFKNSGQTGGTLEHPGSFKDKDEQKKFLDAWRAGGSGPNRHRDKLLTHGVKYNPLKVTNAEAQLLETESRSDTEIFGLWSFPPHRAARLDRATFSNIEQQSIDFVVYCLAPLAISIEQAAERDLLLDNKDSASNGLFVEFNFNALLRGDLRSRYAAYLIGRQGEWLSANDIRRFENLNPRSDPDGDSYKNPVTKNSAGNDNSGDTTQGGQGNDEKPTD